MSNFRLQTKNLLFTWPQCSTNKDIVLQRCRKYFEDYDIQFIVVCRENHHDTEGEHLHACICLNKKFAKRGQSLMNQLNDLADKQGHYESARNLQHSVKYVMKDGDYCSYTPGIEPLTIEEWLDARDKKKNPKMDMVYKRITEEAKSLRDIEEEFKGYYISNKQKIDLFYQSYQQRKANDQLLEDFEDFLLNKYQQDWMKHIEDQDDRKITWVHDKKGGKGKSTLAKYLQVTRPEEVVVFNNGKTNDIALQYNGQNIVVFDFTRTETERINYAAIERIKNGLIYSGKYQSITKIFRSPKVICFANQQPDMESMSFDRWDIIQYLN